MQRLVLKRGLPTRVAPVIPACWRSQIYESPEHTDATAEVEDRVNAICGSTLKHFVTGVRREAREVWSPLISLILQEILHLEDARFAKMATTHHDACCDILELTYEQPLGGVAFFLAEFFKRTCHFLLKPKD